MPVEIIVPIILLFASASFTIAYRRRSRRLKEIYNEKYANDIIKWVDDIINVFDDIATISGEVPRTEIGVRIETLVYEGVRFVSANPFCNKLLTDIFKVLDKLRSFPREINNQEEVKGLKLSCLALKDSVSKLKLQS